MNIGICVKIIPDPNVVVLNARQQLNPDDLVYMINPSDLSAVETALALKNRERADCVTVVSIAPPEADELLQRCLAMGVTRAIRLWDDAFHRTYHDAAGKALAFLLRPLAADLIFCGHKADDDEMGSTGYRIAETLDMPFIQKVVHIENPKNNRIVVTRKLDGGNREKIETGLPAVLGIVDSLIEPRYAKLPQLLDAFRTEIEAVDLATVGLSTEHLRSKIKHFGFSPPRLVVKKSFMPESHLPAPERLRQIMNGGIIEKKETLVEGGTDELSQKFVRFFNRLKV